MSDFKNDSKPPLSKVPYRIFITVVIWFYTGLQTRNYFVDNDVSLTLGRTKLVYFHDEAALAVLAGFWIFALVMSWGAYRYVKSR